MDNLEQMDIFMTNSESNKSPTHMNTLLHRYKMTADAIDLLDDYINHTTRSMMSQSVSGCGGRASVLAQIQCVALGLQNVYFEYQHRIHGSIHASVDKPGHFSTLSTNPYPIPNNTQQIRYLNKVLSMEFNSEHRSG